MISEELGDGDNPAEESEEYREKILALQLPEETSNKLLKECAKLAKSPMGLTKPRCPATIWIPVCPCRGIR